MSAMEELTELLACPRCGLEALTAQNGGHRCTGCGAEFPLVGGIPWLFPEPAVAFGEWRTRINYSLKTLEHEHSEFAAALQRPHIGELTRRRLKLLTEATRAYGEQLNALLAPLALSSLVADYDTNLAFRSRVSSNQSLTTYAYNVHRDWAWGREENERSFEIVRDAIGGAVPGKVLVLGAGAGRLAYDLHMRMPNDITVVMDFNPYLLLLARQITGGQAVDLYEFPYAPKTLDNHAVLNTLVAEEPARAGLHYVLADAHHPPFGKARFDTVVTPWLIDILPEPFTFLCKRINGLLGEGGRWINFGALHFQNADPALRYSKEECEAIIMALGFEAAHLAEDTIPYLCSPASRHGRQEHVVSWRAVKKVSVDEAPRHQSSPGWLIDGSSAVPQLDAFNRLSVSTRLRAFILSLIDGQRSLNDMADVLVQQNILPHAEAKATIREFLTKVYESSQRS